MAGSSVEEIMEGLKQQDKHQDNLGHTQLLLDSLSSTEKQHHKSTLLQLIDKRGS